MIEMQERLVKHMEIIIDGLTVRVEYAYFGWFAMLSGKRLEADKFLWGIQNP